MMGAAPQFKALHQLGYTDTSPFAKLNLDREVNDRIRGMMAAMPQG
jgi:hypothetical protein